MWKGVMGEKNSPDKKKWFKDPGPHEIVALPLDMLIRHLAGDGAES